MQVKNYPIWILLFSLVASVHCWCAAEVQAQGTAKEESSGWWNPFKGLGKSEDTGGETVATSSAFWETKKETKGGFDNAVSSSPPPAADSSWQWPKWKAPSWKAPKLQWPSWMSMGKKSPARRSSQSTLGKMSQGTKRWWNRTTSMLNPFDNPKSSSSSSSSYSSYSPSSSSKSKSSGSWFGSWWTVEEEQKVTSPHDFFRGAKPD